ncbi:retron system putative HNH endonuclease [Algoriphagus halophilus]|uniref:retron system putative HNH endonuclease n=1 Tax=Algoriphagus halophilus TaxID=226505 RepID=UPI00358F7F91
MKKIVKGNEPRSLTQHRNSEHSNYNNYAEKDDLRNSLVRDQRGICCYCMGRIEATEAKMKIEHFLSQSLHPDKELEYNNLFGACLGNMKANADEHCDTFKKIKNSIFICVHPVSFIQILNIKMTVRYFQIMEF